MLYSFLQILIAIGMKNSIWRFLIINLILLQVVALSGQTKGRNPGYLEYENYTVADGFPAYLTKESIQDEQGFIWIATWEGLVRYDGYNFKLYQPDTTELGKKNMIQNIFLDNEGNILCLAGATLREFNPKTEQFTTIEHAFEGENPKPAIYAIEQDELGNIWLGTQRHGLRIIQKQLNSQKDTILSINSLINITKKDSILATLDVLDQEQMIALSKIRNNEERVQNFQIEKTQDFVLLFWGEYDTDGNWADVGWLENEANDTLWFPKFNRSIQGDGRYYSRMVLDTVRLLPGSYRLNYQSNEAFSYEELERWGYKYGHRWGITAIPISNGEKEQALLQQIRYFLQVRASSRWLNNPLVVSLYKHLNGDIYVGTARGMEIFSLEGSGPTISNFPYPYVKHVLFTKNEKGLLSGEQVLKIATGDNGKIWITGYNGRTPNGPSFTLDLFDPGTGLFKQIPHGVSLQKKVTNTGWMYYLNDIVPDGQGGIWLSAAHSGLHHLPASQIKNPRPVKIDQFFYPFDRNYTGPHLHDLMVDQNQNVWVSTNENTIYKLRARSGKLQYIEPPENEDKDGTLTGLLFADNKSNIWITTSNAKSISCYDTKAKEFIPLPFEKGRILVGNMEDDKGNIWFSSSDGQVAMYNPKQQKINYHRIAQSGHARPHFQHKNGQIWVSDMQSNISLFDPKTKELQPIPTYSDTSQLGRWDGVSVMYPTDSAIWAGYIAGGLGKLTSKKLNGRDTLLFSEYLTDYGVFSIVKDFRDRTWIGTFFKGLLLFDEEEGIIKRFSTKNGLLNNTVFKVFTDNQQRLWIQTNKGLQALDLTSDTLTSMRFIEKLTDVGVNAGTARAEDGQFYVSGGKGIYYFNLDSIVVDTLAPSMVLTDFLIDNQSVELGDKSVLSSAITYTQSIRLPYNQNTLAISYVGIHYDNPQEHQYAYRLLGLNDQWQAVGTERTARFNKLAPGQYTFEVKAANMDGVWTDKPAQLEIIIMAPWFWNGWSKLIYLLAGMGLLFYAYQFQLNRQLAEAEAQRLTELDTVKTQLYTNITHEFRTPLTVISGMAEEVLDNPQKWFREGLEMIKRNSSHLLQLVNQLLDLSKLESGSLKANMVQGDVVSYLKYLVESFQSFARSKEIQLSVMSRVVDLSMDFDPIKTQSICSNLLSNAIKFTPNGGVIQVEIDEMPSQKTQSYCQIRISDSGPGIPENVLPYIFDRFYQVDNSATRQAEGTGIGLALTKELVEILQGEIEVDSKIDVGTTFIVKLPISRTAEAASAPARLDPVSTDGSLSTSLLSDTAPLPDQEQPSILLIEDNADVLQYLSSCLADHYQLSIALNGEEGIEKAIDSIPDIIISDVMMPKKDGFEVLQTLKNDERTSHIPIVMLTAKADIQSRIEGLEYGADAYLAKPFHKTELLVRLRKLIELRKVLQLRYQHLTSNSTTINNMIMKEDAFLLKVRRSVESNISDENFGISQLCDVLAISRTQLHRKLKAVTGKPTSHVVRSIRLKKAKTLLQNSELNVSEVGYEVGYANSSHFAQDFRREFGQAPSKFKKK